MSAIQNNKATVENILSHDDVVESIMNKTAQKATQNVFNHLVSLECMDHISKDLTTAIANRLRDDSFMTEQLELTDKQKDKMESWLKEICEQTKDRYVNGISKEKRTESLVKIVEFQFSRVIEEALSSIGREINRGAIISSTAVSADTKHSDYNRIELRFMKHAGDITIPTRGVFISTNCIDVIEKSAHVEIPSDTKESNEVETDENTG